jgi:hypothetical protein
MVRHTHRRRQSRGRRRNTRRSRRTQRGGSFFGFGTPTDADIKKKEEALQQNPTNTELKEELDLARLEKKYEDDKRKIKESVANGAALSSTGVTNNMTRNSAGQFQSPASNANGAGAGYGAGISNMFSGGRRKSRRYRRR